MWLFAVPGSIDVGSVRTVADANSVTLSWSPPPKPNGRIIKYIVSISPPPRQSSGVLNNDVLQGTGKLTLIFYNSA